MLHGNVGKDSFVRVRALVGVSLVFAPHSTNRSNSHPSAVASLVLSDVPILQVYPKITDLNASVEDPRIMGVIREQGGKVNQAQPRCSSVDAQCHVYRIGPVDKDVTPFKTSPEFFSGEGREGTNC